MTRKRFFADLHKILSVGGGLCTYSDMMFHIGMDGCKAGWAMVTLTNGSFALEIVERFPFDPDAIAAGTTLVIDMPIGLSETGPRGCDQQARKVLRPRGSCVFAVPARGALAFEDYHDANRWSKAHAGRGIVKQCWGIVPKIRELDALVDPRHQGRIFESHPELGFLRLNNGEPLAPKRKAPGKASRIKLLEQAGFKAIGELAHSFPRKIAAPDDILDAAILALTARHIADGTATRLGGDRDATGKRMEIWY